MDFFKDTKRPTKMMKASRHKMVKEILLYVSNNTACPSVSNGSDILHHHRHGYIADIDW